MDWDIINKENYDYNILAPQIEAVKEWLRYPNKNNESFTSIIRALIKDILELDAGVLVKVFDLGSYNFDELEPKSGAPTLKPMGERHMLELYARDGASFLKETDKFGFILGYWQYSYQIPAHPMWFNRDEICYVSRNVRSMSTYGYAPTQSIMDIVKSLHYSTLYNKKFFENNSMPDGVLSMLDINPTDMKNFVDNWTREFQAQPHKFAVVNKDIKWQPFTISQRELEFLDTQKWYYRMVISAFGLTPAELGLTEELNRATSATQAELSRKKGIRPMLTILEYFINKEIIEEFGIEGIQFQFKYDDPSEKAQRLSNWKVEVDMGLKTINEIRQEMGLNPVDWGDSPSNTGKFNQLVPMPISEQEPKETPDQKVARNETKDKEDTEESKKKVTKGIDDGQYTHYPQQQPIVAKPAPNLLYGNEKPEKNHFTCPRCGKNTLTNDTNLADNMVSGHYTCINCKAKLTEADLMDNPIKVMESTPKDQPVSIPNWSPKSANLQKDIDLDLNDFVGFDIDKAWAEGQVYIDSDEYKALISDYLDDMSKHKLNLVIDVLREGIHRHKSVRTVTKELTEIIRDEVRAEKIARTELIRINNNAKMIKLEKEGETQAIWQTAPEDGRICEDCAKLDGKVYAIKTLKNKIPLHVNCRCRAVEVTK